MRTTKNILQHELIGLDCEISQARNKSLVGLRGKIIDETLKMIALKTKLSRKLIPKKGTLFKLSLEKEKVVVDGNFILTRPEDRIKKRLTKW